MMHIVHNMQDLLRNKSRLEHDLAIKGNSLGIDRVSFWLASAQSSILNPDHFYPNGNPFSNVPQIRPRGKLG